MNPPTTAPLPLGPVLLTPIFQPRIWGVDKLPAWYAAPAAAEPIGEVWLTAETCVVAQGMFEGRTLAAITPALLPEAAHGFPLLMKVLLPREKLSVQVHPNDEQAAALGLPRGKTECWYILSAEPGATVAVGFAEPITSAEIEAAIADGTLEGKLCHLPVKAGDMVYVDAGTVHAIGPGVVVLETQQYSDVTYRLFDYGRPRELHVAAGLAVTRTTTEAGLVPPQEREGYTRLVECRYFTVDRCNVAGSLALGAADSLQILVALAEGCAVESAAGRTPLPPGTAVLLPAEGVAYRLTGVGEVVRIMGSGA